MSCVQVVYVSCKHECVCVDLMCIGCICVSCVWIVCELCVDRV